MSASECPFCSVSDSDCVLRSAAVFAVRDRYPVSRGHTLVIPHRHVTTYFDADSELREELWRAVDVVKRQLDQAVHPDGYNIGFNAGVAAGQTVMHLHIHVIPRYRGDMDDPRGGVRGVIPGKQKYGGARPFEGLPAFVPGQDKPLLGVLRQALQAASQADMVAAFVQPSGLQALYPDVVDALRRGAQIRLLTGDYMGTTSADALRRLLELSEQQAGFKPYLFEVSAGESFHPKAYVFRSGEQGVAYVGSSNLSRQALEEGIEWNLRLVSSDDKEAFSSICQRFDELISSPACKPLSKRLIDAYEARAPVPLMHAPEVRAAPFIPHAIQVEALAALKRTRAEDKRRGLVVLATGLGKTLLSAFDFKALGGERALFIAHREEILEQARERWAAVMPEKVCGILGVGRDERDADIIFASVQTIARSQRLMQFASEHFDYVVVDEFHRAAASTYRRVMTHFRPRFMLGLTATPDRLDGRSLLELCDDNLVFRQDIVHGISRRLLVPFSYFGVKDAADFAPIPWRNGKFDTEALTSAVATRDRADQALREYQSHAPAKPRRTLVFCCSTRHADYMAKFFTENGHPAASVHSEPSSAPRAESLRKLRDGSLEIICAVDVFNEGLDVPEINTVLMLRPTQSPVIFLQQLGRGLRTADGKERLVIVDFIGNHRSFMQKPQALAYLSGRDLPAAAAVRALAKRELPLPEGCSIDIETAAIDMLREMAKGSREDILLYEYMSFRDSHGRRPTARELFDAGVSLKPVMEGYATWFDFVRHQGDATGDELRVLGRHAGWFGDLQRTSMTKAYKMLALQGLLNEGALFSGTTVEANARAAEALARDNLLLFRELREDEKRRVMGSEFIRQWRSMPLQVWARGESTSRSWFELKDDRFVPTYVVDEADRPVFVEMTEEVVEYRLAQHVDKLRRGATLDAGQAPIVMKVSHTGGKPILRFDRKARPDVPQGEVRVDVEGEDYRFQFKQIAVNVVWPLHKEQNLLPQLMRGWFGPTAGNPGTRHFVELIQSEAGWKLRPQATGQGQTREADVLAFPRLPFYPDFQVACGAFAESDRMAQAVGELSVVTSRDISPSRNFVVRASGDSMDGGTSPIRDGDMVLCEWWSGGAPDEVIGKPFLLVGQDGADTTIAAIKVPRKRPGGWVLESWNPAYPPLELPADGRVEPMARVLEVVQERQALTLWGQYEREQIAPAFGGRADASWSVGVRDVTVDGNPHTILLVTLRKEEQTDPDQRYTDRFITPSRFLWSSQAKTSPDDAKGKRIIRHEAEGRRIHLFARPHKRSPFVYCGEVTYLNHTGSEPMAVEFSLSHPLPDGLWRVWQ
ncbi:MAG: DUF3427 domain-containing protein [Myxococcota bacterium]